MKLPQWSPLRIACLIFFAAFSAFVPVLGFDFVSYDDPIYVDNVYVRQGLTAKGVAWAFTATHQNFSQTLPWLSLMLDWNLYGRNPAGFHFTSLFLHSLNSALLFAVALAFTGRRGPSALLAALFAFHPLHVESVAWVSDRKDLLATFFAFLMLGAYHRYIKTGQRRWMAGTTLALFLSLLSKPVMVILPFLLLLLDFWPLNRLGRAFPTAENSPAHISGLALEKAPLWVLTGVFSWVAYAGHADYLASRESFPLAARLANALVNYAIYVYQFVWPHGLSVHYPLTLTLHPVGNVVGAGALLLAITVAGFVVRKKTPFVLTGWLWFLGTLFPLIGLIKAGDIDRADRYMYFPLIGLALIVAWGLPELLKIVRAPSWTLAAVTGVLVAACIGGSLKQLPVWENSATLFKNAVNVTPQNPLAHNGLGAALYEAGETEKSLRHFQKTIQLDSGYFYAWHNLGNAYTDLQRYPEAIRSLQSALKINPNHVVVHFKLGKLYDQVGEGKKAIEHTRLAEFFLIKNYGPDFVKTREAQTRLKNYYEKYKLNPKQFPTIVELR